MIDLQLSLPPQFVLLVEHRVGDRLDGAGEGLPGGLFCVRRWPHCGPVQPRVRHLRGHRGQRRRARRRSQLDALR